ncbi:MAG: 30S ribosome-binding factor RbfA [Treponema sp.]|jgi:ribosome-binding factor A|nr:30S ribosome-binding factor RbfA [Treponema sp.]
MGEYRLERVGRLIQEKIGSLIVEGQIKDPRVDTFLSITRVRVSGDFTYADVYVSSFKTPRGIAKGIEGLQNAAGFIQSRLAKEVRLRQTPRLRFFEDSGMRESFDLIKKIEGLSRRTEPSGSDGAPGQENASGHEDR